MEFEIWGVSRPLPMAEGGRRTSSSDLEFWTERSEGTKYLSRNRKNKKREQDKFAAWSNQIKAAQPIAGSEVTAACGE